MNTSQPLSVSQKIFRSIRNAASTDVIPIFSKQSPIGADKLVTGDRRIFFLLCQYSISGLGTSAAADWRPRHDKMLFVAGWLANYAVSLAKAEETRAAKAFECSAASADGKNRGTIVRWLESMMVRQFAVPEDDYGIGTMARSL